MTIGDISNRITFFTGADTNQFTNADRLIAINIWLNKIWDMIIASQNGWDIDDPNLNNRDFIKSYSTTADTQYIDLDIVTNKILKIKHVQIKYDSDGTYYKAEPLDVGELGIAKDSKTIANHFGQTTPFYELQGRWMYFYPIPDVSVTNAVDVHFIREADQFTLAELTTGTKVPGFDLQFHDMLAIGPSLDWGLAKNKANTTNLQFMMSDFELRLKNYYGTKNEDRHMQLKPEFNVIDTA